MNTKLLIHNAIIVNEGTERKGSVLINENIIEKIYFENVPSEISDYTKILEADEKYLIPGIIDDQVHFREPGLTYKGDIFSESRAAIAGGITSFMEMPNTNPQSTTQSLLEAKYLIASEKSLANYSFYIGATNNNLEELLKTDPKTVCGIKIFMGSSTGNMLVDNPQTLEMIFKHSPLLIAVHCEDEAIIQANMAKYSDKFGASIPVSYHPLIRSEEACYKSSSLAVSLAKKYGSRLHILHISTAKELELFDNHNSAKNKNITSEVCIHHLWFDNNDYVRLGNLIKWNPAIKTANDRVKLLDALLSDTIDVIATDHAPHTSEEKNNPYPGCPSGGPMVQHALNVMLELNAKGKLTKSKIVQKMCHHPAEIFKIRRRGYIREGYFADLAIIDPLEKWTVDKDNILYKCKWSPFQGYTFTGKITHTFVNGNLVYDNGRFNEQTMGMRLVFDR
jgi:dihydroorotase